MTQLGHGGWRQRPRIALGRANGWWRHCGLCRCADDCRCAGSGVDGVDFGTLGSRSRHNHGGPNRGGVVSGGAVRLSAQIQKGQGQSLKADEGRSGGGYRGLQGLQGFTGRLLPAVKSRAGNVWRTGQWSPADVWRCLAGRLPRHLETGRRHLRLSSPGGRRIRVLGCQAARLPGCHGTSNYEAGSRA